MAKTTAITTKKALSIHPTYAAAFTGAAFSSGFATAFFARALRRSGSFVAFSFLAAAFFLGASAAAGAAAAAAAASVSVILTALLFYSLPYVLGVLLLLMNVMKTRIADRQSTQHTSNDIFFSESNMHAAIKIPPLQYLIASSLSFKST